MDINNPVVQFLITNIISVFSALFALAAVIVAVVIYYKSKSRKEITWERISVVPVKGLKAARLVTIKLWNSGSIQIEESDYRDPIKFNFGKVAKVASIAVVNTKPLGLKGLADKSFRRDLQYLNKIIVAPFLFNPKYLITFQVQISGFRGEITVENSTRIVGVYDIFEKRPLAETSKKKLLFLSLLFIIGGQGLGYAIQPHLYTLVDNRTSPFLFLLGSHFLVLFLKSFAPAVFFSYAYPNRLLNKIMSITSLMILWIKLSAAITIATLVILLPGLIDRHFV